MREMNKCNKINQHMNTCTKSSIQIVNKYSNMETLPGEKTPKLICYYDVIIAPTLLHQCL